MYSICSEHEEDDDAGAAEDASLGLLVSPSGFSEVTVVRKVGWNPARGLSVEECDGPDMPTVGYGDNALDWRSEASKAQVVNLNCIFRQRCRSLI